MACDLWLVPLVDVLCHSPDNPFAEEIAVYDKALGEAGLPPVPVYAYMPGLTGDVAPVAGFDYDALHFLRRAYLLHLSGLAVTPVDELGGDYEQLLEMFEPTAQQSHLVWHYDHAGAYVPVDFAMPLSTDALLEGGGPLGSAHGLLRELQFVGPSIGIDPANPPPAPLPPGPDAGPGVAVRAQPSPGYVGGRVVVTYTVRNGKNALATGLRLRLGLPAGIPVATLPAGCAGGVCALPDLAQGASSVLRVVLAPDRALRTNVTGTLTTTGTDADRGDNVSRIPLRILQPRIVSVPEVGKPGFVTSVRGKDFPPGVPVELTWKPGITATAPPARPIGDGSFIAQLLILVKDRTGPRTITASGPGFSPVTTDFLVVGGTITPPDEVGRR